MRGKNIWKRDASTGYQLFGARARHDKLDAIARSRVRRLKAKQPAEQLRLYRRDRLPNEWNVHQPACLTPGETNERDAVTAGRGPKEAARPFKRPGIGVADMRARHALLRAKFHLACRTGARDDRVFYKPEPTIFLVVRSQLDTRRTYIDCVSRYPNELAPPAWQTYARRQKLSEEVKQRGFAIWLEAMAQLGRYLREEPMAKGGWKSCDTKAVLQDEPPTLADRNISLKESALAQKIAALPEETQSMIMEGATKLNARHE
jgi:hypothetical protein